MYDIIIIGGGPAGLTAAIYARRANKNVLVLEAMACGGQIVQAEKIENYPVCPNISGVDFATKLYEQTKELGAEIKFEKAININDLKDYKEVITKNNTYQGKTVILATGSENRKLGLDNEDDLVGHGVSYCATCDGMFFKNKVVAITGGGNQAIDEALYLSDFVKTLYVIYRREDFKFESINLESLKKKKNVIFKFSSEIFKKFLMRLLH